eukprot:c9087_g1_i1.p1 GENE.c9087_g1_i1~~c9087_g1_i1.p1  ORF type:complete len:231 (+),score=63.31 c9087_g1_i1:758-1450(+)
MMHHGFGVEQSHPNALHWYTKAANQGHAGAQNQLGFFHFHGLGGCKIDHNKARDLFSQAASQNHHAALTNLGHMLLEDGQVVEAKKLFSQVVNNNNAVTITNTNNIDDDAQAHLGFMYAMGLVQDDDEGKGEDSLHPHNTDLQNTANCHDNSNLDKLMQARSWLRQAATHGNAVAQHNLGIICEVEGHLHKEILNEKLHEAKTWYEIAAANGDKEAILCLQRLSDAQNSL